MSQINLGALKSDFDRDGYVLVRNFIARDIATSLRALAQSDPAFAKHSHAVKDSAGRDSKLTLWYSPGDDVYSRLSCSGPLQDIMTHLLDGPISFFHAKLMNKEPKIGGTWEWHQDYGYWSEDGFPRADMASCFIALDPCCAENGALQVIPKSHHHGRLDHGVIGQQAGADRAKVTTLQVKNGTVMCDMEPGDALFFHANTLHASGPNLSSNSRLIMIASYFRRDNEARTDDPRYRNKDTPRYAHDDILRGVKQLGGTADFSTADAHIISD